MSITHANHFGPYNLIYRYLYTIYLYKSIIYFIILQTTLACAFKLVFIFGIS